MNSDNHIRQALIPSRDATSAFGLIFLLATRPGRAGRALPLQLLPRWSSNLIRRL